jgi:hypothetical protein
LSDVSLALKMPSRYSIEKNRGGTRIQDSLSPITPFIIKSELPHHLHNGIMSDSVKSFYEVEFKNDDFLFGLLALIYVLISPGQTILNCPGFYEPILICVDERDDPALQSIGHKLCDDFNCTI